MNFVKNGYDNLDQLRSVTTEELAGWWRGYILTLLLQRGGLPLIQNYFV